MLKLQIGGDRGITGQMWKGNIAEVLIFDRAVSDMIEN